MSWVVWRLKIFLGMLGGVLHVVRGFPAGVPPFEALFKFFFEEQMNVLLFYSVARLPTLVEGYT